MNYDWQFGFVWKYREIIFGGIRGTLEITFWSMLFTTILGLIVCLMSLSRLRILRYTAIAYIETFRAVPTLAGLVWVYYSLPIIAKVSLTGFGSAIFGLTLLRTCYLSEVYRAGIESIHIGQMEAATAVGMSYFMAMRRIILPQAVQRMIPPFINQFIVLMKLTSIASVLAVTEILHEANDVIQITFRPLEVYTVVAVVYFILIFPVAQFSRFLEKKRFAR